MTSIHEIENLPKLIEDNARFLYGIEHTYTITTASVLDTTLGPYTNQAARASLIRYHKDGEGKGKVMKIGIKHGSETAPPSAWRAMTALHADMKMDVELKRRAMNLKEGDEV